jgi:hypothetical protein
MASRFTAKGFIPIFENQLKNLYQMRDELLKNGGSVDDTQESIDNIKKYIENMETEIDEIREETRH